MNKKTIACKTAFKWGLLVLTVVLNGCATTAVDPADPWEEWNRDVFSFNDDFDETTMKPMAEGYIWAIPDVVSGGVSNVFSNIQDIGVTINDLLQFKLGQAAEDGSRLVINSTVGIAGVIDVATMVGLEKHKEDFGQTLGVWGVPSGPYMVLPFWGATSPRDFAGLVGDILLDPISYTVFLSGGIASVATTAAGILDVTDWRAGLLVTEKIVDETALDQYEFLKAAYMQRREYLILDGNVPDPDVGLELDEDFDADLE
jgi:phospholipid-binding lipoprotein MlaA